MSCCSNFFSYFHQFFSFFLLFSPSLVSNASYIIFVCCSVFVSFNFSFLFICARDVYVFAPWDLFPNLVASFGMWCYCRCCLLGLRNSIDFRSLFNTFFRFTLTRSIAFVMMCTQHAIDADVTHQRNVLFVGRCLFRCFVSFFIFLFRFCGYIFFVFFFFSRIYWFPFQEKKKTKSTKRHMSDSISDYIAPVVFFFNGKRIDKHIIILWLNRIFRPRSKCIVCIILIESNCGFIYLFVLEPMTWSHKNDKQNRKYSVT